MDQAVAIAFAAIRNQIGALQAQIDSLALLLETPAPSRAMKGDELCQHLETEDEGSTFGHPRRRCLNPRCRALVEA